MNNWVFTGSYESVEKNLRFTKENYKKYDSWQFIFCEMKQRAHKQWQKICWYMVTAAGVHSVEHLPEAVIASVSGLIFTCYKQSQSWPSSSSTVSDYVSYDRSSISCPYTIWVTFFLRLFCPQLTYQRVSLSRSTKKISGKSTSACHRLGKHVWTGWRVSLSFLFFFFLFN